MWRFLLPGFFALMVIGISAPSHAWRPLETRDPAPSPPVPDLVGQDAGYAADLQRQVNDLLDMVAEVKRQLAQRKTQQVPAGGLSAQQGAGDAPGPQGTNLQRQDSELHNELQELIALLEQQLKEVQRPPASDVAEQQERQAARDGLSHAIADLRQQDNELQDLMAQRRADVEQRGTRPPAPDAAGEMQTSGDALPEHQAANLRSQIADLQRQDGALRRQLAARKQELAQSAQELDEARAEASKLRIDTLRQQRHTEEALLMQDNLRHGVDALRLAEPPRLKAQDPQGAIASARPAAPFAAPQTTQPSQPVPPPPAAPPLPTRLPGQLEPKLPPAQPLQAPSARQQLQTAQQLLSAGRPGEARRVLAMAQTQMIFRPVTHQPAAQGGNTSPSNVGDAIHWLDMGASDQAMRSVTRAINSLGAGG
jgi:hypothetical protein